MKRKRKLSQPVDTPIRSKVPDHTDLWRLIPPNPAKPMFALIYRQDWWNLIYYNESDKTAYKNLWTKDPAEAQRIRDDLYKKAKKLGRGAESAIEAHAKKILWEIERRRIPDKGITYQVHFARRSGNFRTREEAVRHLKEICLDVVSNQARKAS